MSLRFWRRIKLAPGITLNLSKSGGSFSFGPRGSKYTVGGRGQRFTVGLPGTGLFYTTSMATGRKSAGRRKSAKSRSDGQAEGRLQDRLTLGFFKRLVTPEGEEALVDGCRELVRGDEKKSLSYLKKATHLADSAYLAGFLLFKAGRYKQAETCLNTALEKSARLEKYFAKYGMTATMNLPITAEVTAHVEPCRRGLLLALVEIYQHQKRWEEALSCLQKLQRLAPNDVVVRLSQVDLLFDRGQDDRQTLKKIVRLAQVDSNDSAIHTTLMYYKARALLALGLLEAARDTLTTALRRKKDRPDALDYADVAERLNL